MIIQFGWENQTRKRSVELESKVLLLGWLDVNTCNTFNLLLMFYFMFEMKRQVMLLKKC